MSAAGVLSVAGAGDDATTTSARLDSRLTAHPLVAGSLNRLTFEVDC
jgi:hypothetical protein